MVTEEGGDTYDICNVSRGIDSIELDIVEDSNGVHISRTEDVDTLMLDSAKSFSPVKSPKKRKSKHSLENSDRFPEESFPSNAFFSYLLVKLT